MPVKQIYKMIKYGVKPPKRSVSEIKNETPQEVVIKKKTTKKNNKQNEEDMTTEQIERMEDLVQNINIPQQVKVVKKDKGLIERTESSKIVLTEDNRQVLND